MIKIAKPMGKNDIPKILIKKGIKTDKANRKKYDANPQLYAGKESLVARKDKLILSTKIYGADSVKRILKDIQKGKCCYCEKNQKEEYGAVEHYRPKGGYKSKRKDKITKPGYFWLCYEWSNLYFVCSGIIAFLYN
jgi:hypothetical protein